MPFYQILCFGSARIPCKDVMHTVRKCAKVTVEQGGVFRRIDTFGVQRLPFPFRDKVTGNRDRHFEARVFKMFINASPKTLNEVTHNLRVSESVLRSFATRKKHSASPVYDTPKPKSVDESLTEDLLEMMKLR